MEEILLDLLLDYGFLITFNSKHFGSLLDTLHLGQQA